MRQISREVGVSRGTVSTISKKIEEYRLLATQDFAIEPSGPWCRCPDCGGKTQMPCTYCALKKRFSLRKKKIEWDTDIPEQDPFDLELKGKQLQRYLEIKAWRDKQRNSHFRTIPEDWPWRNAESECNNKSPEPNKSPKIDATPNSSEEYRPCFQAASRRKPKPLRTRPM